MRIGVIGTGAIGGALIHALVKAGHEVLMANSRGPDSLADLAEQTGAKPVAVTEAARGAKVVIVAVPEGAVANLPTDLFHGIPDSVVVVDAGNYYPRERDGRIEPIEAGAVESVWVSEVFGRSVVKAFNNIFAHDVPALARPKGTPSRVALPVAGDDPAAKAIVIGLANDIGYDGVDAGSLEDSWRQQPNTPVYVANQDAANTFRLLSEASRKRPPELSGSANSPGSWTDPA
jgi:8-hydroxy-5-deazaflavin:NADPH oxidoreductase